MIIAAAIIGWLVLGAIGSALVFEFWWRRHRTYPMDIRVEDLVFGSFISIAGPINLIIGACFFVAWLVGGAVDFDRVVFRRADRKGSR